MTAKHYSMTGYAHCEISVGELQYRLHLKSVNHRFCEVRTRLPKNWFSLEPAIKRLVQQKAQRGSLDLWVEDLSDADKKNNRVEALFSRLSTALQQSSHVSSFSLPAPLRAVILSRFPDFWLESRKTDTVPESDVLEATGTLCDLLNSDRTREGTVIVDALLKYCDNLETQLAQLQDLVPLLRKDWEKRLKERLTELAGELQTQPLPQERLLQEFLLLAEKRDVAEEMQRIAMHLKSLRGLLEVPRPDGLGKRLEFTLQELHREWTTFGNKIQNVEVSTQIVEAKISLERLREQALNLV